MKWRQKILWRAKNSVIYARYTYTVNRPSYCRSFLIITYTLIMKISPLSISNYSRKMKCRIHKTFFCQILKIFITLSLKMSWLVALSMLISLKLGNTCYKTTLDIKATGNHENLLLKKFCELQPSYWNALTFCCKQFLSFWQTQ